jgi:hypothetical protein
VTCDAGAVPPGPLTIHVLAESLAVARFDAAAPAPAWAFGGDAFAAVLRRGDELSVVAGEALVPEDAQAWRDLRALEVQGPLDFSATGVLASIASPLADAGIWIFALATYDTDVVLVKGAQLDEAIRVLTGAGHHVSRVT